MNRSECLIEDLPVLEWLPPKGMTSRRGYVSGYRPRAISEQLSRLRELFPSLSRLDANVYVETLPQHAEGWFVIPQWQAIAPTYDAAVAVLVRLFKATRGRKFRNGCWNRLGPERLRQTKESARVFAHLAAAQQNSDLLVFPGQFGLQYHGASVRSVRASYGAYEFGLGLFAAGVMLLTHPERLLRGGDLWIDCPGDEYDDPDTSTRFDHVPCLAFRKGSVILNAHWSGYDCTRSSSCTGFFKP